MSKLKRFTEKIDAAINKPDPENPNSTKQIYLFSGDQYLTYDIEAENIIEGPLSIALAPYFLIYLMNTN